jgi:hypothetical protein
MEDNNQQYNFKGPRTRTLKAFGRTRSQHAANGPAGKRKPEGFKEYASGKN